MNPLRTVGVMLVVAGLAASVAGARKSLLVRLKWTPNETDNQPSPVLDITGGLFTVRFDPVADKRNKGQQIGENTEHKTPVPIRTYDNVGAFLDKWITNTMRGLGLTITQDNPERVITLELPGDDQQRDSRLDPHTGERAEVQSLAEEAAVVRQARAAF